MFRDRGISDAAAKGPAYQLRDAQPLSRCVHAVVFVFKASDPHLRGGKYKESMRKIREVLRKNGKQRQKIISMDANSLVKSETGDTHFTLPKSSLRESLQYILAQLLKIRRVGYERPAGKRGESGALGLWNGDKGGREVSLAPKLKTWLSILLKACALWINLL